ncbi:MAG: hypothetical protein ACP5QP_07965 [Brevinematia bacterium]
MSLEELTSKGIPEKIVNFLFDYFKGDIEKVYLVLNSIKKDIVILKMKFSFSIYSGISIMFINTKTSKCEFIKCFISTSYEITKINIELPWNEIIMKISEQYKNFQVDPELSKKAENILSSDAKLSGTLSKLFSQDKTEIDIRRFLYTYIPTIFGDQNAVVRFSYEKIDIFQFYKFMKNLDVELPDSLKFLESEEFFNEYPILEVPLEPILSPLDGVSINNLNIGDRIFVKIPEDSEAYRLFHKGTPPTARITSISPLDNERYLLKLELGPGFLGSFILRNDVKLKKLEPGNTSANIPTSTTQEKATQTNYREFNYKEEELNNLSEEIQKEKDISALVWFVIFSIISLGVAGILILLLFL